MTVTVLCVVMLPGYAVLPPRVLGGASGANAVTEPDAAAFAAVEARMRGVERAVARRDPVAMGANYVSRDPLSFVSHGVIITQRDSLLALYLREWRRTDAPERSLVFSDVRYQRVSDAVVHVTARMSLRFEMPDRKLVVRDGSWSGLFERREGRWALAHEHESFATGR